MGGLVKDTIGNTYSIYPIVYIAEQKTRQIPHGGTLWALSPVNEANLVDESAVTLTHCSHAPRGQVGLFNTASSPVSG